MVHAAQFRGPLQVELLGALLDGEFIFAADQDQRERTAWRTEGGICLFGLAAVLVDPLEHFAHVLDLLEEGIGDVDGRF